MNAVLGLTSTLLETELSRDQRGSIHASHIAGGHLLEILNDILDLSKREAGNPSLEKIPFSSTGIEAHSLKSSAATFGLQKLSKLAKQFERDALAIHRG